MSSQTVNYDCPYVRSRKLETVAYVPYIRGIVLTGPLGSRRYVGSVRGVRTQILKDVGRSALFGWFSFLGLVLNPIFILYGLFKSITVRRNLPAVREYLHSVGLPESGPPDVVTVGYDLAAALIAADGIVQESEIITAKQVGAELFANFEPAALEKVINNHEHLPDPKRLASMLRSVLNVDQRRQVYGYLEKIAWADGDVAPEEATMLSKIANALGLEPAKPAMAV